MEQTGIGPRVTSERGAMASAAVVGASGSYTLLSDTQCVCLYMFPTHLDLDFSLEVCVVFEHTLSCGSHGCLVAYERMLFWD